MMEINSYLTAGHILSTSAGSDKYNLTGHYNYCNSDKQEKDGDIYS